MAQFGGKNPPWARPDLSLAQAAGLPQHMNVGGALLPPGAVPGNIYGLTTSQPGMIPQQYTAQQMAVASQLGQPIATAVIPPVPAVSYQAARPLPQTTIPTSTQNLHTKPLQRDRFFTGTVTKLHDTFGFVDEDVFFQQSVVKGQMVKVGDRVLVEASYNINMPFKWNASRIQVLPNQSANNLQHQQTVYNNINQGINSLSSTTQQSNVSRHNSMPQVHQTNNRRNQQDSFRETERDRERRERVRRERDRERRLSPVNHKSRSSRDRSRSSRCTISPVRQTRKSGFSNLNMPVSSSLLNRNNIGCRYHVTIPKFSTDAIHANVSMLKSRYQNLYIPSDFFNAKLIWSRAFPLYRPFSLCHPCSFHIMHKNVPPPISNNICEPHDVDYSYSAKVMLISCPPIYDLLKKACSLAEENENTHQHPTRMINFLVGLKGKTEPMAIGGAWSQSLDGSNPDKDPRVLINTAIRTTKNLTGIDLSVCTQWYRFLEIRYQRAEEQHRGRILPARVETVVIFLPDVWRCRPSTVDWQSTQNIYLDLFKTRHTISSSLEPDSDNFEAVPLNQCMDSAVSNDTGAEKTNIQEQQQQDPSSDDENKQIEEDKNEMDTDNNKNPSVLLDPKLLKVTDLRKELESRNISSKGLKSQLIARLSKALKTEEQVDENLEESKDAENDETKTDNILIDVEMQKCIEDNATDKLVEDTNSDIPSSNLLTGVILENDHKDNDIKDVSVSNKKIDLTPKNERLSKWDEDERKRKEERERAHMERRYSLPDQPCIICHPSSTAKNGKFDCTVMSLSVLLDYRPEDNKEHSFEVSLFAELFNEMLSRDFGFMIYKGILATSTFDVEKSKESNTVNKKNDSNELNTPDAKRPKLDDDDESCSLKSENKEESVKSDDDQCEKQKKTIIPLLSEKRYTALPNLLLAFSYYDQNMCGYILNKDCEDIIHSIGLYLSRSQIKRLLQKIGNSECIEYRKITDKNLPIYNDENLEEINKLQSTKESFELDFFKCLPSDEILANGNRSKISTEILDEEANVHKNANVFYKGAIIDVEQILSRLDKSESGRLEVERRYAIIKDELESCKKASSNKESANKQLEDDVLDYKRRLREQKRSTDFCESRAKHLVDSLRRSHDLLDRAKTELGNALAKDEAKREREKSDRERRESKKTIFDKKNDEPTVVKCENEIDLPDTIKIDKEKNTETIKQEAD